MKLSHRHVHFNDLPLWTAARVRDLKHHNPAASKLRKRLGVSEALAGAIADLSGLSRWPQSEIASVIEHAKAQRDEAMYRDR